MPAKKRTFGRIRKLPSGRFQARYLGARWRRPPGTADVRDQEGGG